jgi:periplasmic divalent cation tolerance protein
MNLDSAVEVRTAVDSEESADIIATAAVKEGLAACAQITGPVKSIYEWKGELHSEEEWLVSFKTLKRHERELMSHILRIHPYETPECISIRLESVSADYMAWMRNCPSR